MKKIAFIFPGQGTQYIGMAKDFYDTIPESKEVFEKASRELGLDIAKLCFDENDEINKTEYTQVAIITACISILRAVEKEKIKVYLTAGLSLGEYSALVASGVLSFEQAVALVRKRGIFMATQVPSGKGAMSAVLGLDINIIEEICREVNLDDKGIVEIANYNCPGQIVITGEKSAVLIASEKLKQAGAKRVIQLNVSGPFHSSLLRGAGEKLALELDHIEIKNPRIPYVNNYDGQIVKSDENIKGLLEKQVYSGVKWQQSVELMINEGIDCFVEIGPGKTLSSFIRKIDKSKLVINIEKLEDLEKLKVFQEDNYA